MCSATLRQSPTVAVSDPSKHRSVHDGRVREYIYRAEIALGHPLPPQAHVHHVNGNRLDNRNCNLVICEDQEYHYLLHRRQRIIADGFDPDTHSHCYVCGYQPRGAFYQGPKYRRGGISELCKSCYAVQRREIAARKRSA